MLRPPARPTFFQSRRPDMPLVQAPRGSFSFISVHFLPGPGQFNGFRPKAVILRPFPIPPPQGQYQQGGYSGQYQQPTEQCKIRWCREGKEHRNKYFTTTSKHLKRKTLKCCY
uniref:(northern house mosquito) hypothetical protein n=1 Tax=Culex pipiens TaxID=7175 RepID=A0A8D8CPB8_CULPI